MVKTNQLLFEAVSEFLTKRFFRSSSRALTDLSTESEKDLFLKIAVIALIVIAVAFLVVKSKSNSTKFKDS